MTADTIKQKPHLEDFGWKENDIHYWWASWYGEVLGYKSFSSFKNPLRKALQACVTLGIDLEDNFIKRKRVENKRSRTDYQLSRFACYLIAMNADSRKPAVAKAQVYFAEQIEKVNILLSNQQPTDFDRLMIREELKQEQQDLISAAARSGVRDFRLFMSEGYVGLYNHSAGELKTHRNIPAEQSLYDFMGETELAANLFRLSLTRESLDEKRIRDQEKAIIVHKKIAEDIRRLVKRHTGNPPEQLAKAPSLRKLSQQLKKANRLLK